MEAKETKEGKLNLTAFKNAEVTEIRGIEGVFIPIKDNHLIEAKNQKVYATVFMFPTDRLKPYTHRIVRTAPEEERNLPENKFKYSIGAIKLV